MPITQKQAIERGATHFIEQYRAVGEESDYVHSLISRINRLDRAIYVTNIQCPHLTTVAVFLIKPKKK